ncbi:hypothetical protein [Caballeronia glathei]|uniref:hypothetical protein n=1 Tax=Caballeronia glathei TaxID=60547 RepID=UPI00101A961B|nr:hypothetical protein [Caballeronia glathei]
MKKTDWFPPESKPVRVGIYESQIFDAGWMYDWFVWWDGRMWRDKESGWTLENQNITWRGIEAKNEEQR